MLPITHFQTTTAKMIDMLPETFEKIKGLFKKKEVEVTE